MAASLSVCDVRHQRGRREVLRVDRLDVPAAERISVLGPNGTGKTTLLRLLAAVDLPSTGEVRIDGTTTRRGGVRLRRRIAYVTQRPALLSTTVRRNVELPLRWRKVPAEARRRVAQEALERLSVVHLADRPACALSGGEQQRVSLARALALDPDVLLLDEPSAALDVRSRAAFLIDLDRALADRPTTVVHVTHRPEDAFRLADQVVILVDGAMRQVGSVADLHQAPVDGDVAALVGYENLVDSTVAAGGEVLLGDEATGLRTDLRPGPVRVAVFANGVRLAGAGEPGVRLRVTQVAPGPGHWSLTLAGTASLVARISPDEARPERGDLVKVRFDPALSAVVGGSR